MIDEKRLHLMIGLARYEQRNHDGAIRIHKSDRGDYIALSMIGNFLLSTIAYVLLLVFLVLIDVDYSMDLLNKMSILQIIAILVISYLIFLGIYSIITYTMASLRYARAEHSIEIYEKQLDKLRKLYQREDRRKRRAAGEKREDRRR